jgi:hypothetical protein
MSMDEYIEKTIRAYDDTKTYEDGTRLLVPEVELNEFTSMLQPGVVSTSPFSEHPVSLE